MADVRFHDDNEIDEIKEKQLSKEKDDKEKALEEEAKKKKEAERQKEEEKEEARRKYLQAQIEKETRRRRIMIAVLLYINYRIRMYRLKIAMINKANEKMQIKLGLMKNGEISNAKGESIVLDDVKNPSDLVNKIKGIDFNNPALSKEFAMQGIKAQKDLMHDKELAGKIKDVKNEVFRGSDGLNMGSYSEFPKFSMGTNRPKVSLNFDKSFSKDRDFQREKPSVAGGYK